MTATITVNGERREIAPGDGGRLLGWLRGHLGLTGAKPACGEGVCGACTVLLDGTPVLACQTALADASGHSVTTAEGLATGGRLHPVQAALIEEGATQCGYCTPGIVLRAAALLVANPRPDARAVIEALDQNLCRCGCYPRILRAVLRAADRAAYVVDPSAVDPGVGEAPRGDGVEPPLSPASPWDMQPPRERDYAGVLGPGMVWVAPAADSGGWLRSGGAWLHVGPSGVTAFSGKVDVGQDNRTALRMLVAEELSVPLESVRLVLGDTDLCPYDAGTFGSRSMLEAGQALRQAAAGAGARLRSLAADRWGVPVGTLSVVDGVVTRPDGARLPYGDLVAGSTAVELVDTDAPLRNADDRRLVGRPRSPERADAVTGRLRFVSDLRRPGMEYGAVLRPPHPRARLVSLDTRPAAHMPGVTVVEEGPFVGAVAADLATARAAVRAVVARYEADGSPEAAESELATYLRAHPVDGQGWEGPVDTSSGNVDRALEEAGHTLRATYSTAYVAHAALETHAALAEWSGGRLHVWTGTQVPFAVRAQLAGAFGLDEAAVRVVVPPTGGAFGGKHGADVATEAARLARAAGRPVLVHWSRGEEFLWGSLRPMALIDVRAGLDDSAQLAGWDFVDINGGSAALDLPYEVKARRIRYQPAASPLRQSSYRALAATANNFARECAIDELAERAGEDPVEFRARRLADDRLAAVLAAAASRFGWASGCGGAGGPEAHGDGVAVGLEKGGRVATCAAVTVDGQGRLRVRRVVTAYECGTIVNPDTVANQIEGATVMGLGGALFEAVGIQGGAPSIRTLADYPVPRFHDLPAIDVVLIDRPDLPSAGAGETPMIALAPAIANALYAATGRRVRQLPLASGGIVP